MNGIENSAFRRAIVRLSEFPGDASMKKLVTALVALGLMAGCVTPTLAAEQHKTKASCEKAHMKWDSATKTCS
jgi:hypothetical protein